MTTATKTPIKASWNPTKIQQETAEAFARNMAVTMQVLNKLGPQAVEQWEQAQKESEVNYYKSLGVKTPLELVKAKAEFETHVFGSKIQVWGDDKQAWLEYEVCGCYNAMQKVGLINEKNAEEMGKGWLACLNRTAQAFGFSKAEAKFGSKPGEPCATISFIR